VLPALGLRAACHLRHGLPAVIPNVLGYITDAPGATCCFNLGPRGGFTLAPWTLFPYRCAGDRPVAKRELVSLKALGEELY